MAEGGRIEENKTLIFGERRLEDPEEVFQHNAWDHVEWDTEHLRKAEEAVKANSSQKLSEEEQRVLKSENSKNWDSFYQRHQTKFFKDRQWLFRLFPELQQDTPPQSLLEVGCGVGNTVFPLLQTTSNLFVHCCDFSSTAIELVKANPLYNTRRCSAFVHDIASDEPLPLPPNSIDLVSLIFVLSAIPSERFNVAISKLVNILKPGGKILFRDHGRLDLAQLRFKPGKCLADNQYTRNDGTLAYFFTEEKVSEIMEGSGLIKEMLQTDRQLTVNRGKQLTMYRVWVVAKYCKIK